ncbi:MAG: Ig-like domain-containing protein [Deltaproteobacteria bacterium]|nr:Ig-like domain-containing protein [Deltaproteobacteria bacterium]
MSLGRIASTSLVVASFLSTPAVRADEGPRGRHSAAELGLVPVGGYVRIQLPERPRPMLAEATPTVLFLNRDGGAYTGAWTDDSVTNQSSILSWDVEMPEYPYGDASWNQVLECMRDLYADFNVEVTDEDPGDTPHVEVVVSGHPSDIGMQEGVGGIAPMACQPVPNAIAYAFPETYGDYPQGICEAAGQESAHAFGLDHEFLCEDVMTYLFDCQVPKSFIDADAPCGEFSERACSCGGDTQNSYQFLLSVLGPAENNEPPSVVITGPEDGDEVSAGFTVSATASDDGAIDHLELWIDSQPVVTRQSEPWEFSAPDDIAEGDHEVEVLAFDDRGASASALVIVEVTADGGRDGGDRRSRGGCSAGGGNAGGLDAVAAVLALLFVCGSRRARRARDVE